MSLTVRRLLPAFLLVLALSTRWVPSDAAEVPKSSKSSHAAKSAAARLALYSPRVRRSTITYLRLRLLELHEEGLDRARQAIQRRLSVDELLADPRPGP